MALTAPRCSAGACAQNSMYALAGAYARGPPTARPGYDPEAAFEELEDRLEGLDDGMWFLGRFALQSREGRLRGGAHSAFSPPAVCLSRLAFTGLRCPGCVTDCGVLATCFG